MAQLMSKDGRTDICLRVGHKILITKKINRVGRLDRTVFVQLFE